MDFRQNTLSYDAFRRQRLLRPLVRQAEGLFPASWEDIVSIILDFYTKNQANLCASLIAGPYTSMETGVMAKLWANRWFRTYNFYLDVNVVSGVNYSDLFNENYRNKSVYFLFSFNPRLESPLVNLELRRAVAVRDAVVVVLGNTYNLTYKTLNLGVDGTQIMSIFRGSSKLIKYFIKKTGHIFLGHASLNHWPLISLFKEMVKNLNKFSRNSSWSISLVPLLDLNPRLVGDGVV